MKDIPYIVPVYTGVKVRDLKRDVSLDENMKH